MKKFKNIKLMLVGFFCLMGVNAFALDTDMKTDGSGWYYVDSEAKAQVVFYGISKTVAEPKEYDIPATVDLPDDDGVSKKTYKVIGAHSSWWTAPYANVRVIDPANTVLESLTFSFRTDWDANMIVDGTGAKQSYNAINAFRNTLKKVVIKDAHKVYQLPEMTAANYPVLETVDFSGVSNDGAGIIVIANFLKDQKNLKSVKLPANEPLSIRSNAFEGICGTDDKGNPTEVKDIDISKATEIYPEAFKDAFVTEVVIGENVAIVADYAFNATDATTAYLKKVTWKTNKVMGGDPSQPRVTASFVNQVNIEKVVVAADKVKFITTDAFTSAAPTDDKGNAIPFELDLSAAPAMATIAGGIPAIPYKTLKLQGTALKGDALNDILGFDLMSTSQKTLVTLTLPDGLTALAPNEFKDYEKLSTIGINMAAIPDDAFSGCAALATLTLGEKVKTIGASAFEGTQITNIKIPAGVTSIGANAFANICPKDGAIYKAVTLDLSEASNLATIGGGVFADTNITGTVDFSTTKVTAIPASAFEKSSMTYGKKDTNFLTKVVLKEGSASSKVSIGSYAFAGNPKLAAVDNLNQANYDFDAKTSKYGIGDFAFYETALTKVELDQTPITVIAAGAFSNIEALETVKLNAATTAILDDAFDGDTKLATVENLNNDKLTTIGDDAFYGSAIETLDLSDATSLSSIGDYAFAQNVYIDPVTSKEVIADKLKKVIFPKETNADGATKFEEFTNKISTIGEGAFFAARNLKAIENLKDCKITSLPQMFTTTSDPDDDDIKYCPATLTSIELPAEAIIAADGTTLYAGLYAIEDYALQGLGIENLVIPSTVTSFGVCVLQGCLNLKKVEWYDALVYSLDKYTFRGNTNLEEFYYMTALAPIASNGITDKHFYWCSKEKLTVYVTAESLLQLRADGYTTANAKYSKLNDELEDEIELTAQNNTDEDKNYYRTYYNESYATWFAESDVKIFTAEVEGSKVVMTEAKTENGYYKVKRCVTTPGSENYDESVCIIQSAEPKVKVEYYAIPENDRSTLAKGSELLVTPDGFTASAIHFYFKLGKGPKGIGFYRITKGEFKPGAVYIAAADPSRTFLPIVGDETAIKAIEEMVENDAPVYNLQGVRVNDTHKGFVIKNGKKYIVK